MVTPLAEIEVECPSCGRAVRVEVVAQDLESTTGPLRVELRPLYSHECPSGGGERVAS